MTETVTIPARCILLDQEECRRLPPSARRVYAAIIDHGPATLPQLQAQTSMPRRTVAYAISRLKEADLVLWHQRLDDYRVRYFSVHPRLVHDGDDACRDARRDGAIIRLQSHGMPPSVEVARWLTGR